MNSVKKVLVMHGDARIRRRLVLLLAGSGHDVRATDTPGAALETARCEWFDLALLAGGFDGNTGFSLAASLKSQQPAVPIVLLVPCLELPIIIQGIRSGMTDVLADAEDPLPLLKRVNGILRGGAEAATDDELTAGDLAEVEQLLARLESAGSEADLDAAPAGELRDELVRGAHERAALELRAERLAHEKAALEAELRTLLAQVADGHRLQAELAGLQTQRELAAATQAAIDAKAGKLTELREEIARERSALDESRRQLAAAAPARTAAEAEIAAERDSLELFRQGLHTQQERLRDEAARLRQEATQVAQERRRWHEDLELIAAREDNLRAYEERLRRLQAQLESDRVLWFKERREPSASPFREDAELRTAWERLQRATELLAADQAVLRDERLAMRDLESSLKRREESVRHLESKEAEIEKRLRNLPPPPALTRSPFSIWGKGKS